MAYGDFTLPEALHQFRLTLVTVPDLHGSVAPVPVGGPLRESLDRGLRPALTINSEKIRSEFLIAPVLLEAYQRGQGQINLLSGADLDVDPAAGLNGRCDFLLGRGPQVDYPIAPLLAVVEAKNESIAGGLGQCAAEMVAIQRFNQQEGTLTETVHGVVSSGDRWRFLRLSPPTLTIDNHEYLFHEIDHVLAIFLHVLGPIP